MSIDVDLEELERRKSQRSSTPASDGPACERCGCVRLYHRGHGHNGDTYEHDYYCRACEAPCDGTGEATIANGSGGAE